MLDSDSDKVFLKCSEFYSQHSTEDEEDYASLKRCGNETCLLQNCIRRKEGIMPTRRKEEYPECLEEKKKQHGKKEGIGIVVNKCLEDECPLKEECRSYLVYPAIGNKEFAENMMSILHKQ